MECVMPNGYVYAIHVLPKSTHGRLAYVDQAVAKLLQCVKHREAQELFGDILNDHHVDYIWKYT